MPAQPAFILKVPPRREPAREELVRCLVRAHLSALPVHRALIRSAECLLVRSAELERPLLDLGCGDGHFGQVCLAERMAGPVEVGVDRDLRILNEARGRGVYCCVVAASADALPLPDRSFATVVSNCVLEHIRDLAATLREIHRVLRPRGLLVITVPTDRFPHFLGVPRLLRALGAEGPARAYGSWFNRLSRHFHCYAVDEWLARLRAAGFAPVRHQQYLGPDAVSLFDFSHYYGIPTLLTRRITGRWVLLPNKRALPWERWLEDRLVEFCRQTDLERGAYLFVVARKVGALEHSRT